MDGQLLTYKDLAALLQLHRVTLSRMRAAGKLPPCIIVGSVPRWHREKFLMWLKNGCPPSETTGKQK